jgi:hypothetical protein
MPKSKRLPSKADQRALLRAAEACKRNYHHYPYVIGIGVGLKFRSCRRIGEQNCIHFYVRRKVKSLASEQKLPRFVYGRRKDGTIDYSRKLCTDVIELRRLRFTCKSGTEIGAIGESGTLTLLFQNRVGGQRDFYLITCAHVAGDVRRSPPISPRITSSCCKTGAVLATTIVNSTHHNETVDYDIALARITPECTPQPERQIIESSVVLSRFLPSQDIRTGMRLDCAFPISNVLSATVSSLRTSLPLVVDGRSYQVNNLFLIDRAPRKGDSGGLLYDDSDAVGILVGMSDGFGLFQPLGEAFSHLQTISPVPIRCF